MTWRIYDSAAKCQYTTEDEISFLKSLFSNPQSGVIRQEKLRRYRMAMKLRRRWGLIDPDVVLTYLTMEIGKEDNEA